MSDLKVRRWAGGFGGGGFRLIPDRRYLDDRRQAGN
jgi:hypothetical protein